MSFQGQAGAHQFQTEGFRGGQGGGLNLFQQGFGLVKLPVMNQTVCCQQLVEGAVVRRGAIHKIQVEIGGFLVALLFVEPGCVNRLRIRGDCRLDRRGLTSCEQCQQKE